MLFNSFEFLVFFPTIVALYFAIPYKWRWFLLLCGSYYFYMAWKPEYVILILFSTIVDYYAARFMSQARSKRKRKKFLYLSLATNLGLLFGFKYFNFFNESIRSVFDSLNIFYGVPAFDLLLPVGISFYTFQTLSYTIDVYKGELEPETHFGKFALYVSFFPQLVAGPIERSTRLLPQLHLKFDFDNNRVVEGLRLMLWGFFKKVVIADRLAVIVNQVYNNPTEYHGLQIVVATIFFAFQIFCDFSGYSDIAIGAAKVFGIDLMKNFDRPYFARSISEFWKRWHISLSTWFRDYVYIPLGGNRTIKWRWYYNLFITFLVSGLWHGANWTFVVWGAIHGIYLVFAIVSHPFKQRALHMLALDRLPGLLNLARVVTTFVLVCFGWVFFRANSLPDAITLLGNMLAFDSGAFFTHLITAKALMMNFALIAFMTAVHILQKNHDLPAFVSQKPALIRWPAYVMLTLAVLYLGGSSAQEFIYFQF